jgi:hypothetical protein
VPLFVYHTFDPPCGDGTRCGSFLRPLPLPIAELYAFSLRVPDSVREGKLAVLYCHRLEGPSLPGSPAETEGVLQPSAPRMGMRGLF